MKDENIENFIKNTKFEDAPPVNFKWRIMLCLKYLLSRIEALEEKK